MLKHWKAQAMSWLLEALWPDHGLAFDFVLNHNAPRQQLPVYQPASACSSLTLCSFMEELLCRMGCVSRAPSRALMTEQR